jgi:replicative DNA helicase
MNDKISIHPKLTNDLDSLGSNLNTQDLSIENSELKEELSTQKQLLSGFNALDKITNGWKNNELIFIAGRPGMGKTTFVNAIISNISIKQNKKVLLFDSESHISLVLKKLISSNSNIEYYKIRGGKLNDEELIKFQKSSLLINNAPLIIDDTPRINISEIRQKIENLLRENTDLELIIIDYIQMVSFLNRENIDIVNKIEGLKNIAIEFKIPILITSQLNLTCEEREGDKRPNFSDIDCYDDIEKYLDHVYFLYRPEYYRFYEDEKGNSLMGLCELMLSKIKNNKPEKLSIEFKFDEEIRKISEKTK